MFTLRCVFLDNTPYVVCVKDKYGNYQNCSSSLAANTESYTFTGITPYTNKKYVVIVSNSDNSEHEESTAIYVKTTHTWNGELQKCINEYLGYGEDNTTHIPTKSELEAYNSNFECSNRGDMLSDINPVVDLINISELDLPHNNLTGSIPDDISRLTKLEILALYENNLSGSIPSTITTLSSLRTMYLHKNNLTGTIPAAIGSLSQLEYLYLYDNQLSGSIPEELGMLDKLKHLILHDNELSGVIPEKLYDISTSVSWSMHNNHLSGHISDSIGNLIELEDMLLNNNELSGAIPDSIRSLTKLEELSLHENKLTANIPEGIDEMSALKRISLSNNRLSGMIPSSFAQAPVVNSLYVNNNCNLWSEESDVQDFINAYGYNGGGPATAYNYMLDSNSHDCMSNPALLMYLLN